VTIKFFSLNVRKQLDLSYTQSAGISTTQNVRICFPSFSFPPYRKGRGSVMASASEPGVQRPKTFGAGLGWREAQRRGLGTAQVPKRKKPAEPFSVQPGA
jgi:hypothetical protein